MLWPTNGWMSYCGRSRKKAISKLYPQKRMPRLRLPRCGNDIVFCIDSGPMLIDSV